MLLIPKNWREFQHYKDRSPPWIRLHRKLLDNADFQMLPIASRALAPMLWLLASESLDGSINADAGKLSWRLRQPESQIAEALKPLIDKGFFSIVGDDCGALADRLRDAVPETETETETEALQRQSTPPASPPPAPKQKRKSQRTPIPEDFGVSERVQRWAASKGFGQLDQHLDAFRRKCLAKGYLNVSWDDAFMEAIREDWAKLRGRAPNGAAPPPESVRSIDTRATDALAAMDERARIFEQQRRERMERKAREGIVS